MLKNPGAVADGNRAGEVFTLVPVVVAVPLLPAPAGLSAPLAPPALGDAADDQTDHDHHNQDNDADEHIAHEADAAILVLFISKASVGGRLAGATVRFPNN